MSWGDGRRDDSPHPEPQWSRRRTAGPRIPESERPRRRHRLEGRVSDQVGLVQPIKSLATGARPASRAGAGRRQERRPGATGARRRLGGGSALGLRWGELIGLHRRDVDLEHRTVRVRRAVAELSNGQREIKAPKSAAGKGTVSIPGVILADLHEHLKRYAEAGPDGRVFVGAKGATPRRNHFNRLWHKACREAGVKGLHFHDLRHTGNTLAASTGASTRELMTRMGHSTARAALIYQHASADRDRLIADALSGLVKKGRKAAKGAKKDPQRKGHAGGTPA
ncbi:tyrosine-type recombinase/integrase [Streptomyces sp. NPDC057939]|uniref:tyrosine-type recombinase/integrase n=1 Tax=Streptomyces sp. NPDC057939 TaxID=3346284 RepID=UPI0036E39D38